MFVDISARWARSGRRARIEDERHNFDDLNIPADHPARDSFDTFFLSGNKQAAVAQQTSPCRCA